MKVNRNPKGSVAPGRGTLWRPLTRREQRTYCCAIGLGLSGEGVCSQRPTYDSRYCFYHDLVQRGIIDSFNRLNASGGLDSVSGSAVYPVWPLPREGYAFLNA